MLGRTFTPRGGESWRHHSAQDQPGRKASGVQAREGPEATGLPPPQPDLRVKYGEGEIPAQGSGRQETRTRAPSGYQEGHPDGLHAMRRPQGRELEAGLDQDEGEAIADGPPEVSKPRLVVQRTQTQHYGGPHIEAKQDLPGERNPQSLSIQDKEAPGTNSASRGKPPERKHSKVGDSRR